MSALYLKNKAELVESMFDEFGYYFCEHCQRTQSFLQGHHIIWRSERPGHPNLHDKVNILLVCFDCHDKFHRHRNTRDKIVISRGLDKIFDIYVL